MADSNLGGGRWPCGHYQRQWIESTMERILKAEGCIPEFQGGRWIVEPPDPLSMLKGRPPVPGPFYLQKVGYWIPHLLGRRRMPCCPRCESAVFVSVFSKKSYSAPRVVYDLHHHWYLVTVRYKCSSCNYLQKVVRVLYHQAEEVRPGGELAIRGVHFDLLPCNSWTEEPSGAWCHVGLRIDSVEAKSTSYSGRIAASASRSR